VKTSDFKERFDMNEDIFELRMRGYCCSQIIMELGLRKLGKENPDMIRAMAGLCNGMWHDKTCGVLSAAICLLCLANTEDSVQADIDELYEWFEDVFGSAECDVLIGDNPLSKSEKCPIMLEATFKKVSELLDWD
jgi:hypothetical protein